jgi:hypothetical protein
MKCAVSARWTVATFTNFEVSVFPTRHTRFAFEKVTAPQHSAICCRKCTPAKAWQERPSPKASRDHTQFPRIRCEDTGRPRCRPRSTCIRPRPENLVASLPRCRTLRRRWLLLLKMSWRLSRSGLGQKACGRSVSSLGREAQDGWFESKKNLDRSMLQLRAFFAIAAAETLRHLRVPSTKKTMSHSFVSGSGTGNPFTRRQLGMLAYSFSKNPK